MFRILVYDVERRKIYKTHKYLMDKLYWVQNSMFTGFLSDYQVENLFNGLSNFLNPDRDSVILFSTEVEFAWEKKIIGKDKSSLNRLIR